MFRKILVAVDRSTVSRKAFEAALPLAKGAGGQLILIHILSLREEESPHVPVILGHDFYPPGASRSVLETYEELWRAYEKRGLDLLRAIAAEAQANQVPVEIMQGLGTPGPMICEFAQRLDADLIILGRQSHHFGLSEWILGSVSNYVLHHAPCSVLIVHERQESMSGDKLHQGAVLQPDVS